MTEFEVLRKKKYIYILYIIVNDYDGKESYFTIVQSLLRDI